MSVAMARAMHACCRRPRTYLGCAVHQPTDCSPPLVAHGARVAGGGRRDARAYGSGGWKMARMPVNGFHRPLAPLGLHSEIFANTLEYLRMIVGFIVTQLGGGYTVARGFVVRREGGGMDDGAAGHTPCRPPDTAMVVPRLAQGGREGGMAAGRRAVRHVASLMPRS